MVHSSKRKAKNSSSEASDSDEIQEASSVPPPRKKQARATPEEVLATAARKISRSNAPGKRHVSSLLRKGTATGEEVLKETIGGLKKKMKGKGRQKVEEEEAPATLVTSIGFIIQGLEVNPALAEGEASGETDDGLLPLWKPFFPSQKHMDTQIANLRNQKLIKIVQEGAGIRKDMSFEELDDCLRLHFPTVFANFDKNDTKAPLKQAPYVLCSKLAKAGYQPNEGDFPDGEAVAALFALKRPNNAEKLVIFASREKLPLVEINPEYVAGRRRSVRGSQTTENNATIPTTPGAIADQLTDDDDIAILAGPSQFIPLGGNDRVLRPRPATQRHYVSEDEDDELSAIGALLAGPSSSRSSTVAPTRSPSPMDLLQNSLTQSLSFVAPDASELWKTVNNKTFEF